MSKVLFVPLNTNHVLIFDAILRSLNCEYEILCHDRVSDAEQYHTENTLNKLGLPFRHFENSINRSPKDNLLLQCINFFKIKKEIINILLQASPDLVVLAIDNDPIVQIVIKESKKRGIRTVLVQEALIRPHEYTMRETYLSDYFYRLLQLFGIYLKYIKYGSGNCDRILAGGKIAADIIRKRGVPENRIVVVGQPKFDTLVKRLKSVQPTFNKRKVCLFAPSTKIVQDDLNVQFLQKLVEATDKLGLHLIIKLHPRAPHEPSDIYNIINVDNKSSLEIVKEGDDTFEILKRSDALITVSSTIILEALMMDKECVVANYLAGESRLEYGHYDAINSIESEDEIYDVIKNSILSKKSYKNKKCLLDDELYKLDGKASQRTARFIESMISQLH